MLIVRWESMPQTPLNASALSAEFRTKRMLCPSIASPNVLAMPLIALDLNPLNPKLPFGYIILRTARKRFCSSVLRGQGEVGGVTRRVTGT